MQRSLRPASLLEYLRARLARLPTEERSPHSPKCDDFDLRCAFAGIREENVPSWRRGRPPKRFLGEGSDVTRIDSPFAECLDKRDAVTARIVRYQIGVGRDERAK